MLGLSALGCCHGGLPGPVRESREDVRVTVTTAPRLTVEVVREVEIAVEVRRCEQEGD